MFAMGHDKVSSSGEVWYNPFARLRLRHHVALKVHPPHRVDRQGLGQVGSGLQDPCGWPGGIERALNVADVASSLGPIAKQIVKVVLHGVPAIQAQLRRGLHAVEEVDEPEVASIGGLDVVRS